MFRVAVVLSVVAPLLAGCGSDSDSDDGGSDPLVVTSPDSITATGLYADAALTQLGPGVHEYRPEFELWSDGADKRRFVFLPEGEQIDNSDADNWVYPAGTKLWKEFVVDGLRVETRFMEKLEDGSWELVAYAWNDAQSDADMLPEGASDVAGTSHDIPKAGQCQDCHRGMVDTVIGFSQLLLSHDGALFGVAELAAEDRLSSSPPQTRVPGDGATREALGYLHANCGNCHNSRADNPLDLWLESDGLGSPEDTTIHRTAVGQATNADSVPGMNSTTIVAPGDPGGSLLYLRMQTRAEGKMPWLGSEQADEEGLAIVASWIQAL